MIRHGDIDSQGARPRSNLWDRIAAIRVAGVKMHVKDGMFFLQKSDIGFFKIILLLSGMILPPASFVLTKYEEKRGMFNTHPRQSQRGPETLFVRQTRAVV